MSWDIFFQDWGNYNSLKDIPDTFTPKLIGSRDEIITKILEILPDTNFENKEWGILEREKFSIEFNMGKDEKLYSFALHIRGDNKTEIILMKIIEHLKIRGADGLKIYG